MLRLDADRTITSISIKKEIVYAMYNTSKYQSICAALLYFPRHNALLCVACVCTVERIIMLSVTSTFTSKTIFLLFLCYFD